MQAYFPEIPMKISLPLIGFAWVMGPSGSNHVAMKQDEMIGLNMPHTLHSPVREVSVSPDPHRLRGGRGSSPDKYLDSNSLEGQTHAGAETTEAH